MSLSSEERRLLIEKIQKRALKNQASHFQTVHTLENALKKAYRQAGKEIISKLQDLESRMGSWEIWEAQKYQRLDKLLEQIRLEVEKLGGNENALMHNNLSNLYVDSYLSEAYLLGQHTNVNVSMAMLSPHIVKEAINYKWSGAMFSDRIWDNKTLLLKNLREGVTQSLILGESMRGVADRINKNINTSLFNALRIARTETMRVIYTAEHKAMQDNGIEKVQYLATTSDERTCDICGATHEKIFILGEEPMLPRHPQCRCTYVPYFEDLEEVEPNQQTQNMRETKNFEEWKKEEGIEVKSGAIEVTKKKSILSSNRLEVSYEEKGDKLNLFLSGQVLTSIANTEFNKKALESVRKAKNKDEFEKAYYDLGKGLDTDLEFALMDILEGYRVFEDIYKVEGYEIALNKSFALLYEGKVDAVNGAYTNKEKEAINFYTGSSYRDINGFLRFNKEVNENVKNAIQELDSAFNKTTLADDFLLQRGSDFSILGEEIQDIFYSYEDEKLKDYVGTVLEDRGYMSTTINTGSKFSGGVVYQIKAPKGTKAMYVNEYSVFKNQEFEVLLPRGTKLQIQDLKRGKDGNLHVLMDII